MAFEKKIDYGKKYGPRKNEYIRVKEVQLIDEKGENVGIIDTQTALEMAKKAELDLVEVGANANPPVCKIMNYSKYIYIQSKKNRENKKGKARETKEFRFTPVIDSGDLMHRVNRAKEYLKKNYPVKLTMVRKGRQPREQALETFNEILTNFTDYSSIEAEPTQEGTRISLTFKPNGKTENK